MAQAITTLTTGALNSEGLRQLDLPGSNYKASMLASNAKSGIPNVLLQNDNSFLTVATLPDWSSATGATVRYVIDRQCLADGPFNPDTCVS